MLALDVAPAPLLLDDSGFVRTPRVLVSMHRGPLTLATLDVFEDMQRSYGGTFVDLQVYRLARVRPGSFTDDRIRRRIIELGSSTRIEKSLIVIDGPGLANAGVRIAFASVLMLMPHRVYESCSTLADAWLRLASLVDANASREARAAIETLTAQMWPATQT